MQRTVAFFISRESFLFLHKPRIPSRFLVPKQTALCSPEGRAPINRLGRGFSAPGLPSPSVPPIQFEKISAERVRQLHRDWVSTGTPVTSSFQSTLGSNNSMETVYCGYSLRLHAGNSDLSGVPTAVFNFSVKWHRLLVFVDRLGVPMNLQDTTLSELSQSLEMPLCILPWQSLCERHLERVLGDLGVHYSFWTDIIRVIMRTAIRGSRHGRRRFDMSVKLELATKEEVMEDIEEGFIGGHESDPDRASRGVSRSTIEKLERASCFVRDGDECCCICLEKLNGASKVIEIPCSHLFHSRCIVEWLKRNVSCPLCRSKVEVEDPE